MRGKRLACIFVVVCDRNIPAYAGKTEESQPERGIGTEHPRVCGENPEIGEMFQVARGTSPRMRGKPRRVG